MENKSSQKIVCQKKGVKEKDVAGAYNYGQNIWGKLRCSCEVGYYSKGSVFMFQEFLACIEKIFICERRLRTRP